MIVSSFFLFFFSKNLVFWKIIEKFDENVGAFNYFSKLGLRDNVNLSSSIIYQFPNIDNKRFTCYEFPKIKEGIFQKQSMTEYEIPQYIRDIPEGFSIFCTLWEASKIKQYLSLSKEEQDKLSLLENEDNDKDDNDVLTEPVPKGNVYCHICCRKYEDYLAHIKTFNHKNNLNRNAMMKKNALDTFQRINLFWNEKNNELNSDNEKLTQKKNSCSSISTISSAISISKTDDNFIKDINSFNLDSDILDFEKYNDKENQSQNEDKSHKKEKIKTNIFGKNKFLYPYSNDNKGISNISSAQSSLNLFINKKRKNLNLIVQKGQKKNICDEDTAEKYKDKDTKKIKRNINLFFK